MKVLIPEDATAIIPKREFHSRYNAILDGGLPLDITGLPVPNTGLVTSTMDKVNNFKRIQARAAGRRQQKSNSLLWPSRLQILLLQFKSKLSLVTTGWQL